MLLNEPMEYPEPEEDDPLQEVLHPKQGRHENDLRSAPPLQKEVLFCHHPAQVSHLKWWLTNYFEDHVDIFHMYVDMGNDECTEMHLKFQDSRNSALFITKPKGGGTSLYHTWC